MSQSQEQYQNQYYLITNVSSSSSSTSKDSQQAMDLSSKNWKSPVTIDDRDLMFDGKPLCSLAEEDSRRWMREHSGARDHHSRGRSRTSKK